MPRYDYECIACGKISVVAHLSNETADECPKCLTTGKLKKLLTTFRTGGVYKRRKTKVGNLTDEFIEQARGDLARQKEELKKIDDH